MRGRSLREWIALIDVYFDDALTNHIKQPSCGCQQSRTLGNEVEQNRPGNVQRMALCQLNRGKWIDRAGRITERNHHTVGSQ